MIDQRPNEKGRPRQNGPDFAQTSLRDKYSSLTENLCDPAGNVWVFQHEFCPSNDQDWWLDLIDGLPFGDWRSPKHQVSVTQEGDALVIGIYPWRNRSDELAIIVAERSRELLARAQPRQMIGFLYRPHKPSGGA